MRSLRLTYLPDVLLAVLFATSAALASSPSISDDQLQLVVDRLAESAQESWELGTRAQALLELNAPFYSVFSTTTLPPPHDAPKPSAAFVPANLTEVLDIARNTVQKLLQTSKSNSTSSANNAASNSSSPNPEPLVANDGSAGDPASIGVSVLLANWTLGSSDGGLDYVSAATAQLRFLLEVVPRTNDGAISHRTSEVQLWSDFIYMVPPFLAYYGALTNNVTLLQLAYTQISLYRSTLRTPSSGLWKHIQLGNDGATDDGHWSTGNGWAAAGTLRVLATMEHLNDDGMKDSLKNQRADLNQWVGEILDGMYRNMPDTGLFHNYADNTSAFQDGASTALIAASTYRLALLTKTYRHLPNAERSRMALSSNGHIDSSGWLNPVVNPLDWHSEGSHSPEAQAFVVEMQSAWKDWVAQGSPGKNAALPGLSSLFMVTVFFPPSEFQARLMGLVWGVVWTLGVSAVRLI